MLAWLELTRRRRAFTSWRVSNGIAFGDAEMVALGRLLAMT